MADCPLADECPSYSERIAGMGCQHYGNRGGAEWCNHYSQPISELKSQPVQPGEEVVVDVFDIHESGAGVARTDDGYVILIDGVLPDARSRVRITKVRRNHARAEEVERLAMDEAEAEDEDADSDADTDEAGGTDEREGPRRPRRPQRLGSRENFWGS